MFKATWRSLKAHKARLLLSALAVVLGVAFVVGTFIFTDTLKGTFDELFSGETPDVVVTRQLGDVSDQGTGALVSTVPQRVVREIREINDVERVTGDVQVLGVALIDAAGDPVGGNGPPQIGASFPQYPDDPKLNGGITVVSGRAPEAAREVVVDEATAERGDFSVGDTIDIVTQGPRIEADLVGIARVGTSGSLGGATLALFERGYAQDTFMGQDAWTQVSVTGTFGVPPERLRDQVMATISSDYAVATGAEVQSQQAAEFTEALGFINTFLLVFAFIALFVGTFIILNTFSMLVARRTKELALLRAIGASKAQITWSVIGEAFLLGLFGGAVGVGLGIAVAAGLRQLLAAIGVDLPAGHLVIEPRTIVWGLVVGTLVTVIAAWFPARRASRVPPVAAMRDDVALPARGLRVRAIVGTLLTLAGLGLLAWTLSDPELSGRLRTAGLGAAGVLVGIITLAPVFSRVAVGVLGAPVRAFGGAVGRLSVRNAQRDRRRTAATATAIMIGLALVTAIGVLGASTTKSIDSIIDEVLSADAIVTPNGFIPFSPEVAEQIREVDGVETVSQVRQAPALVKGAQVFVTGVDPQTITEAIRIDVDPAALGEDGIAVDADTAASAGVGLGDRVEVNWGISEQTLRVDQLYPPAGQFSGWVVGLDTMKDAGLPQIDTAVYVLLAPDADSAAVMDQLREIQRDFPTVTVQDQTELKESISGQISQLLNLVYALLALSVVIAIFGVINTLALSVIERTREIGMLRAVGTTRRQIRTMIRWESIVISFFGATIGVLLGLGLGIALQRLLADEGITRLGVPVPLIVSVLVATAVVGVLAAVWPARRAARLDVLDAIRTE